MKRDKRYLIIFIVALLGVLLYIESNTASTGSLNISIPLFAIALGFTVTFFKGYFHKHFKLAVIIAAIILSHYITAESNVFNGITFMLYLLPSGLAIMAYGVLGGLVSFFITSVLYLYLFLKSDLSIFVFLNQILVIGISVLGFSYFGTKSAELSNKNDKWLEKLHAKINELSLLKEVSTTMQNTTDLNKINRIILTAVTAGYGLGFNRAVMFLVKEDNGSKVLKGEMAIGPLSQQEAYRIWGNIVRNQTTLNEVIAIKDEIDTNLNEFISKVEITIEDNKSNPLIKCLSLKSPANITCGLKESLGEQLSKLAFVDYALVPLVSRGVAIGVLLVDNKFNGKPITDENVDSLVTFANQSALAIENTMLYEQISHLAITDGLTKLYNHRYFKDQLAKHIFQNKGFALLVIDVDDFKNFNECYGHSCGDSVLSEVGRVLKAAVGSKGFVARYGGDEFTVILPNLSRAKAKEIAFEIQEQVREVSYGFNGVVKHPLTLSIGLALFPEDAKNEEYLFKKADNKLKLSKISGKNTVT